VDLNAASVTDLNGLGGGMIGRAIIAGRPYRTPEDLLAKRILNKATFARIRDQIITQ
jgi:DNA uptake protein ComE-like DNA-binding protein